MIDPNQGKLFWINDFSFSFYEGVLSNWILLYSLLFRRLYLIISLLIHKDEDVKSEAGNNRESIFPIVSLFHSIKCSEDKVDAAKSKVWE